MLACQMQIFHCAYLGDTHTLIFLVMEMMAGSPFALSPFIRRLARMAGACNPGKNFTALLKDIQSICGNLPEDNNLHVCDNN